MPIRHARGPRRNAGGSYIHAGDRPRSDALPSDQSSPAPGEAHADRGDVPGSHLMLEPGDGSRSVAVGYATVFHVAVDTAQQSRPHDALHRLCSCG